MLRFLLTLSFGSVGFLVETVLLSFGSSVSILILSATNYGYNLEIHSKRKMFAF